MRVLILSVALGAAGCAPFPSLTRAPDLTPSTTTEPPEAPPLLGDCWPGATPAECPRDPGCWPGATAEECPGPWNEP